MKYVEEYLKDVIKIKPLGELTTKDDELNGMSGEMVYINGKCSDIFISHADYANWLETQGEQDNWAEELNTKIKELHKQCLAKIQEYITPCLGKMSEEDENHIIGITQTIGGAIKHNVISHKTGDMQITWLKSLKNRVIPQPKQEWSEHKKLIKNDACVALTKKMLYDIILDLKVFRDKDCSAERKAAYQREIDWLENLKKELEE